MQVQEHFHREIQSLLSHPGESVLVAVSGGIDSMVLLHLFSKTNYSIGVAHCNFQLREQAKKEKELVEQQCRNYDLPFYYNQFQTRQYAEQTGLSIQMAARELRYKWLSEIWEKHQYSYIATAHHLNDSLETILLNLTKGTGILGLTGIQKKNGKVIRPLLTATKKDIQTYANEQNITYLVDKSNFENQYERNKIRNEVVPVLKEINPGLESTFATTLKNLQFAANWHQRSMQSLKQKLIHHLPVGNVIYIRQLMSQAMAKQLFYELIRDFEFTPQQSAEIFSKLETATSGAEFNSPGFRMVKDRQRLIIGPIKHRNNSVYSLQKNDEKVHLNQFVLHQQFSSTPSDFVKDNLQIQVDAKKLNYPLVIRKWMPGDYFYPLGLGKKQKLKKFFINEKFSVPEKEAVWLLTSNEKIVWIIGHRMDDRFRITEQSKEVVRFWTE